MLTLDKPGALAAKRSAPTERTHTAQNALVCSAPNLDTPNKPEAAKKAQQKQGPQPLDRLLSMRQAAEQLGCHIATVRRLIAGGKLIAVRVADRKIGIRASSIEAHMATSEIAADDFTA